MGRRLPPRRTGSLSKHSGDPALAQFTEENLGSQRIRQEVAGDLAPCSLSALIRSGAGGGEAGRTQGDVANKLSGY